MTWDVSDMPDMSGRVVLITGGNAGLGRECAFRFAEKNAEVIITGRSEKKCEAAAKEIREQTANTKVSYMVMDLSSMKAVNNFVTAFRARGSPLHVLMNNAGTSAPPRAKTEEGFEIGLATNHFGHFLLTYKLLDIMKASAPARVVTVSSWMAEFGTVNWADVGGSKLPIDTYKSQYGVSKLYNVLFGLELERRLTNTGVHSFVTQPGGSKTEIFEKVDPAQRILKSLVQWFVDIFCQDVRKGALSQLYAASAPELEGKGGLMFGPGYLMLDNTAKWSPRNRIAHDLEAQRMLWEKSEQLLGLKK